MTVYSAPQPTIFVSYSRQDEDLVGELKKQLSNLKVPVWYDQEGILPGANWEDAIRQSLDEASIILLLVSPNFIASNYCYNIEAKRALELHRAGQAQVIPILLRAVDWHATPFADLQCLPRSRKPVEDWPDRDEAFRDVTGDIRIEVQKCQHVTKVIKEQMSRTTVAPASLDEWISRKTAQREESEKLDSDLLLARSLGSPQWFTTNGEMVELFAEKLLDAKLYGHALEVYNSRLLADPFDANLHLGKGEALLGLGRYQEALAAYEEAIHLAPDFSKAYKGRGRVYEWLALQTYEDLKQQAQECYEKAKQLGIK